MNWLLLGILLAGPAQAGNYRFPMSELMKRTSARSAQNKSCHASSSNSIYPHSCKLDETVDCKTILAKSEESKKKLLIPQPSPLKTADLTSISDRLLAIGYSADEAEATLIAMKQGGAGSSLALLPAEVEKEWSAKQLAEQKEYYDASKVKTEGGKEFSYSELRSIAKIKITDTQRVELQKEVTKKRKAAEEDPKYQTAHLEQFREGYEKGKKTFEQTKRLIMAQFKGTNAAKVMESVKFVDFQELSNPVCMQQSTPAVYNSGIHTIALCPHAFDLPEAGIVQILAHELAHAVDFCSSFEDLVSWDAEEIRKKTNTDPSLMKSLSNDERQYLNMFAADGSEGLSQSNPEKLSAALAIQYPDAPPHYTTAMKRKLMKLGLLHEVKPAFKNKKEFKNKFIGYEAMKCHMGNEKLEELLESNEKADHHFFCREENTIHSEVMCDYVASKVLGAYLEEQVKAGKDKEELYEETVAHHAQYYCEGKRYSHGEVDETHLSAQIRMEDIFLGNQKVRRLLQCDPSPQPKKCSF